MSLHSFQKSYHSGMLDKSRMVLCMFLFSVFIFNPFGTLTSGTFDYSSNLGGSGRTILGEGTEEYSWADLFQVGGKSIAKCHLKLKYYYIRTEWEVTSKLANSHSHTE